MALIVFDPWAPAHKGQLFLFTIGNYLRIEELSATIGVNPEQRKREELASLCKGGQHGVGALIQPGARSVSVKV